MHTTHATPSPRLTCRDYFDSAPKTRRVPSRLLNSGKSMLVGSDGARTISGEGGQAALLAEVGGQVLGAMIGVCPPFEPPRVSDRSRAWHEC